MRVASRALGGLALAALAWLGVAGACGTASAQSLSRPTACSDCIGNWYYFDQGDTTLEDWSCGMSTYGGHVGSDFSLIGNIGAIDTGYDVVATADGTVSSAEDGHFDECMACGGAGCGTDYGFGYGNHVVIEHDDGHKVIYAHMRQGSITVSSGDRVSCGQVIGQIGSSGCSTGAHLHVETRPSGGAYATAFDPFEGGCSPTSPSLWIEQGPYEGLPGAVCGDAPPTCPDGTYEIWTCTGDGARERCIDGEVMTETCEWGCQSMPVGTDDTCAPPPDADGDGARADVDCDDDDATRFPGAGENCGDGIDQDCDGSDLPCPGTDAGPGPDGGPGPDAGASRDGGPSGEDGGLPAPDGGSSRRGGPTDGRLEGGCDCSAPGRSFANAPLFGMLLGIAVLAGLRRRRP